MEKIAVFLNDGPYALETLAPLLRNGQPRHWVLVACAPNLTRHIGRFVSVAARDQWRERWAVDVYAQVEPLLKAQAGSRVDKMLARRSLLEVATRLEARMGGVLVFDARRPRLGRPDEPLAAGAATSELRRWTAPVAITTGLSAMLALAD